MGRMNTTDILKDLSGNQNNGSQTGFVNGDFINDAPTGLAWGAAFNGSTARYFDIGDQTEHKFADTDAFTILVRWRSGSATTQRLVNKRGGSGAGYFVELTSTGKINAELHGATSGSATTSTDATTYGDDEWHLAAITYNGGGNAADIGIMIDGAVAAVTAGSDDLVGTIDTTTTLRFGLDSSSGNKVNGVMSEVAFFDGVISLAEFQLMWNENDAPNLREVVTASTRVGHWMPGDTTVPEERGTPYDLVRDRSGNGLDARSNGPLEFLDHTNDSPTEAYSIDYEGAGAEYTAVIGDPAELKLDVGDAFTITGWAQTTDTASMTLAGKRIAGGAATGYELAVSNTIIYFQLIDNTVAQRSWMSTNNTDFRDGDWHRDASWHAHPL